MEKEKTFYLIGGPNGSGKSTLVHQIIKTGDIEILNLDNIATMRNVSNITAARQLLSEDLPRVLQSGHSFALESTLSGTYDARIIKTAQNLNYRVVFAFAFLESVEQNIERVAQRVRMGGHGVDVDTIRRRYKKSLHNFHKIVPLVDNWFLFYNGEIGKSYRVASGTKTTADVEHKEFFSMFCDNCFNASVRESIGFVEIGAGDARIMIESIDNHMLFSVMKQLLDGKQR